MNDRYPVFGIQNSAYRHVQLLTAISPLLREKWFNYGKPQRCFHRSLRTERTERIAATPRSRGTQDAFAGDHKNPCRSCSREGLASGKRRPANVGSDSAAACDRSTRAPARRRFTVRCPGGKQEMIVIPALPTPPQKGGVSAFGKAIC